jgi:hypothetical protein
MNWALRFTGIVYWLVFMSVGPVQASPDTIYLDNFDNGISQNWETKSFAGQTEYRVVDDERGRSLCASSAASASGLIYPIDFDPFSYPILSWRWKIAGTIPSGNAHTKAGDDYAARVYVVFPHWFFPKTKVLNYIWANALPKGEMLPNAFTENAMMFAVESGQDKVGQWVSVRRNLVEDYRRAFGEDPPEAGAVAIMTDTDNTGESASAWYDDIRLERQ